MKRCWWPGEDQLYIEYHDREWGRPVVDDHRLFEKICLEGFQSGLSWITILRKRENFRKAFRNFDPSVVAKFGARDVQRLLKDAGIQCSDGTASTGTIRVVSAGIRTGIRVLISDRSLPRPVVSSAAHRG